MEQTVAQKVCTIRERVADLIGTGRFRTWFGTSTEFQLDGQRLGLTVANAFVGNWISANYLPQVVAAAREVVGTDPQVEIRVGGNAPAGIAPASAAPAPFAAPPIAPAAVARLRPAGARPMLRGELDSFVVGPSNELAFSVASALVHSPGNGFKHLVVHGGCGLGKTHLLQGICNGVDRSRPGVEWRYVSGEEFTNEFIYAVKTGRVDPFRARFRNVDLLVIDDIHFLANKKATQEEFLHTFNAIDACGKTVVLSSDRHPRAIGTLPEPLLNRLIAAMVVQIDPPDFAVRREILRRRAAAMLCELPPEALDYVARSITRNVRELEGALYKLTAYASLTKEPMGLDLVRRAIEEYAATSRPPEAAEIERLVGRHFGVTREALRSVSRDRTVTQARAVAMYLIRKHTRMSFPEIGRLMGNKQHTTVLMAVRRIQNLLDRDGAVAWKTSAGTREVSARALLEELEQRLVSGRDAN